jgi:hypothetical protein
MGCQHCSLALRQRHLQFPLRGYEACLGALTAQDGMQHRCKRGSCVLLPCCGELKTQQASTSSEHGSRDWVMADTSSIQPLACTEVLCCVRLTTGCDPRNDRNAALAESSGGQTCRALCDLPPDSPRLQGWSNWSGSEERALRDCRSFPLHLRAQMCYRFA